MSDYATDKNNEVTMEEIVALAKRRGFVFPSSEIYGGLGSTYDYGHYGVLLKNNVKNEWWRAMLTDRDDIVAIDSAIIQHPRVWEASGHLEGFSDPLVQCLGKCKRRWRLDHLQEAVAAEGGDPDGEIRCPECGGELSEPREFNLMFKTHVGPVGVIGIFVRGGRDEAVNRVHIWDYKSEPPACGGRNCNRNRRLPTWGGHAGRGGGVDT